MAIVTCLCPPTKAGEVRHPNGDRVELRERLDFRSALTARNTFVLLKSEDAEVSVAEIMATLTETYLLLGVRTWSVVDDKGKPVEVSKPAIREYLLSNEAAAMVVGEEADELYSAAVITPLVVRAQNSLPTTPTSGSTSATNGSSEKPPRPSKRSSTSTTQTVATERTLRSLDGGSSSLPNSA